MIPTATWSLNFKPGSGGASAVITGHDTVFVRKYQGKSQEEPKGPDTDHHGDYNVRERGYKKVTYEDYQDGWTGDVHTQVTMECLPYRQNKPTQEDMRWGNMPEPTCAHQFPTPIKQKYECFCKPGYIRESYNGPCILKSQCPRPKPVWEDEYSTFERADQINPGFPSYRRPIPNQWGWNQWG